DLLHAEQLHQDQVHERTHAHGAPCLSIVMVLAFHQSARFHHAFLHTLHGLIGADVGRIHHAQFQLHQRHGGVVDDTDQLGPDPLAHLALTHLLQRPYALRLDHDLIGERGYPEDPPCRAIVLCLAPEQVKAFGDHGIVLTQGELHGAAKVHLGHMVPSPDDLPTRHTLPTFVGMTGTTQTWRVRDRLVSPRFPLVMGILNATPDSFHAPSRVAVDEALRR